MIGVLCSNGVNRSGTQSFQPDLIRSREWQFVYRGVPPAASCLPMRILKSGQESEDGVAGWSIEIAAKNLRQFRLSSIALEGQLQLMPALAAVVRGQFPRLAIPQIPAALGR